MTEFVRFESAFEYRDPKTKARTRYPAGWSGELEADRIKAARSAGALPADETESAVDLERLSKADLLQHAKERGLTIADTSTKAEILAAINAAG